MSPISPTLTASSSATAYNTRLDSASNPFEMSLDKVQDFSDMFDFEHFDSADSGSSSHGQSPNTISPNHTPSPLPMNGASPQAFSPSFDFLNADPQFDFDLGFAPVEKAPPAKQDVVVKQEPVEFGFTDPSIASSSTSATTAATPAPQGFDFSGLPADQQQALQELLANMIHYQSQYGAELPVASPAPNQASPMPMAMPKTVQPAMVFNPVSAQPSASTSTSITPASVPAALAVPAIPEVPSTNMDIEHDDEPLVCITEQRQDPAAPPADDRSERQGSTFSAFNEDIDSKIEALVPHAAIFSAGRGKGGKKGGGMSSVVRAEDEELDDDDSWRPSPEEYKKLSSKEKRQLRNKLSARAFRNRRKDYIGTLEGHIKDRDHVIDAIKSELVNSRSENQDLRRELAALKASTMAVLHPETANVKGESPAMMSALAQVPQFNNQPSASTSASQPIRRAPTPKFNVRKDVPSSPAAFNMWNNNDPLNGGSMICHTTFTPDLTLPEPVKAPFVGFADFPRMNINPGLNDTSARMPSLSARANEKDLSSSFSEWSETNAFSLRSMDSYRIQMWSRLAREAAHEKTNTPADVRPKFLVESASASAYAQAAQSHISSKLASSFMSAFTGSGVAFDADKLAAVVTGRAKLAVVDVPVVEKEKDEAELLAAALGGLKLQSGMSRVERQGLRVRENPLAALGNLFKCPCPI